MKRAGIAAVLGMAAAFTAYAPAAPATLAELRAQADPVRAEGEKRYLKSDLV
ncbi:hypothetical protein GWI34_35520, partial [Actinomadura sp. DSM 109109]|nr:hypothetical protein [Actinomadura lepetitiana]